jgi:hypothetical protein
VSIPSAERREVVIVGAGPAALTAVWTLGRNGLHRYNNQDHSMLTGLLAAQNVFGAGHDVWNVNVNRSYHEEIAEGGEGIVFDEVQARRRLANDAELRAT